MNYYRQQLNAPPSDLTYAFAANSVSAINYRAVNVLNNAENVIGYNTADLGTPSVSAGSAINITTTWGDVVQVGVYHNASSAITFVVGDIQTRSTNLVTCRFSAVRALTSVAVSDVGRGDAWYPEWGRKHNLGYY